MSEVLAEYAAKTSLAVTTKPAGREPWSGGLRNALAKARTLNLLHGSNAGMAADRRLV